MTTDPQLLATLAAARQHATHDRQRRTGDAHAAALALQLSTR